MNLADFSVSLKLKNYYLKNRKTESDKKTSSIQDMACKQTLSEFVAVYNVEKCITK